MYDIQYIVRNNMSYNVSDNMSDNMSEDIKKFMNNLVPLDLILIQGTAAFSKLIEKGSKIIRGSGQFTHCGLVINKKICPNIKSKYAIKEEELLFMEVTVSIINEVPNIETGGVSLGAQVRILSDVLEELLEQGAGIAVAHLKENPYTQAAARNDNFKIEQICHIISMNYEKYVTGNNSIYDLNLFSLLGTIFPSVRGLRDKIDDITSFIQDKYPWLFCSELICIIYRDLGLLDKNIDVQAYLPVDFVHPGEENVVHSIMELPPVFLRHKKKKCSIL